MESSKPIVSARRRRRTLAQEIAPKTYLYDLTDVPEKLRGQREASTSAGPILAILAPAGLLRYGLKQYFTIASEPARWLLRLGFRPREGSISAGLRWSRPAPGRYGALAEIPFA